MSVPLASAFPLTGTLDQLKKQNAEWARRMEERYPGFFTWTSKAQHPRVLWIGCADSRVPESVIMNCFPGQIFTHRNIAGIVKLDDPNSMSVITYAVAELGVEHIVVAGHTNCGGAAVCLAEDAHDKMHAFNPQKAAHEYAPKDARETVTWPPPAPLDTWLADLRALAESLPEPRTVLELVKANVREQVLNVINSDVVRSHWYTPTGKGHLKGVHGWLYQLDNGLIQDLDCSVYASSPHPFPHGHPLSESVHEA